MPHPVIASGAKAIRRPERSEAKSRDLFSIAFLVALAWAAVPAQAETREVTGQYGVLGEWDLVASVTKRTADQWTGPVKLRHVGFCTQDGPEEKTGELQLRIDEASKRIQVTLLVDGKSCTFSARNKQGYDGVMRCPDRRPMPMMLSVD